MMLTITLKAYNLILVWSLAKVSTGVHKKK